MSLCRTCRHSLNFERHTGEEFFYCCVERTIPVPHDIIRCSDFADRTQAEVWGLEKIAWMLRTDKGGRATGFSPPKKRGEEN